MRCYLIRHAVTGETGARLSGRKSGIALSGEGRVMAERLAEHLGPLRLTAVYTSPIQRCRETAAFVAARHALEPIRDARFTEVDYGAWTGRSLKSLHRLKAWQRLMAVPSRFAFPEGETLREAQRRSVEAVEDLAVRHPRQAVAVVAHSDVIRLVLTHYLGMPLDAFHRLDVAPASVSVVDLSPGGAIGVPIVNHVADPGAWR